MFRRVVPWAFAAVFVNSRMAAMQPSVVQANTPKGAVPAAVADTQPPANGTSAPIVAPWRSMWHSLSLSGFAEIQRVRPIDGASVRVSAAELDGTVEFGPSLQGAFAVARNDAPVALAAGFLDLHIGGARIAPRGKIFAERGMHLQAGRFDIPFGADWQRFAPVDRALVSAPAITEYISDGGLNDVGVRAFSVGARWNATAWLVRGALAGRAVGARVALTPFSNPFAFRRPSDDRPVELGWSMHLDGREGRAVDSRTAVDLDLRHGDYNLAAEWQGRHIGRDAFGLTAGRATGWHVATELPVGSYREVGAILLGRFERMRGDALGTPGLGEAMSLRRVVAGARVALGGWGLVKGELGWRLGAMPEGSALPAHAMLLDLVLRW